MLIPRNMSLYRPDTGFGSSLTTACLKRQTSTRLHNTKKYSLESKEHPLLATSARVVAALRRWALSKKELTQRHMATKKHKSNRPNPKSSSKATWRDVVEEALRELGGKASFRQLNEKLKGHPKTKSNAFWEDKIRQVVQIYPDTFARVKSGVWRLVKSKTRTKRKGVR